MRQEFEFVADALLDGFGREHLDETLRYLSVSLGCSATSLAIVSKEGVRTITAIGAKLLYRRRTSAGGRISEFSFPIITDQPDEVGAVAAHFPIAANSRNLLVVPVIEIEPDQLLVLACASFSTGTNLATAAEGAQRIVQVIRSQVRLLEELAEISSLRCATESSDPMGLAEPAEPYRISEAEHLDVVTDFLLSTLIRRRSMRVRRDLVYFGVRSWRSPLKNYQISALRAVKRNPPPAFVQAVAAEVAAEAVRLVGRHAFHSVTSVPCGHSGPNGFSVQLGVQIARNLQLPFIEAFAYKHIPGSSHPKANVSRPPMRLIAAPGGNTLLVDDVATSGAHIAEAGAILRKAGTHVTPLAWISS